MSWFEGPCTTQLFGMPCFWIARIAKVGQLLSSSVIVVEIIGKERVTASGLRLSKLIKKLHQSGWFQKQQERRRWLVGLIAIILGASAASERLARAVGVPLKYLLPFAIASGIAIIVIVILQWLHGLLIIAERGTRMIGNVLERKQLSFVLTICAFIV